MARFGCNLSLQTVSICQAAENPAISANMNCRRFAVIAVFPGVLVHIGDDAHASGPTYRQATATATILPSATAKAGADDGGDEKSRKPGTSQPVMKKLIDKDGFITTAANPQRHVIHIVDLP
jgi:hypothetical protein